MTDFNEEEYLIILRTTIKKFEKLLELIEEKNDFNQIKSIFFESYTEINKNKIIEKTEFERYYYFIIKNINEKIIINNIELKRQIEHFNNFIIKEIEKIYQKEIV